MRTSYTIYLPDRSKEELTKRERMIERIEAIVGTLEVEWCTMDTESLTKLYDFCCK